MRGHAAEDAHGEGGIHAPGKEMLVERAEDAGPEVPACGPQEKAAQGRHLGLQAIEGWGRPRRYLQHGLRRSGLRTTPRGEDPDAPPAEQPQEPPRMHELRAEDDCLRPQLLAYPTHHVEDRAALEPFQVHERSPTNGPPQITKRAASSKSSRSESFTERPWSPSGPCASGGRPTPSRRPARALAPPA